MTVWNLKIVRINQRQERSMYKRYHSLIVASIQLIKIISVILFYKYLRVFNSNYIITHRITTRLLCMISPYDVIKLTALAGSTRHNHRRRACASRALQTAAPTYLWRHTKNDVITLANNQPNARRENQPVFAWNRCLDLPWYPVATRLFVRETDSSSQLKARASCGRGLQRLLGSGLSDGQRQKVFIGLTRHAAATSVNCALILFNFLCTLKRDD